jgi:tetraprenyl-beta-curcumene synthase
MGQYADSVVQFLQYALKVLPELRQQYLNISAQKTCIAQIHESASASIEAMNSSAERINGKLHCSSFFALHSGVDMKGTLSFIMSLYELADTLTTYIADAGITEEPEVRRVYGCLSSAVDPSRNISCAFANSTKTPAIKKKDQDHLLCMSDQCRLQLAVLPSFSLVAPKLKKYIQLHIDLHAYSYYPEETRMEYLQTWSEYYLKRYQEISFMEFCAASDSLLGVISMYAAAANPGMSSMELKLLDEACFPWLCGLESLLHAYISARLAGNSSTFNFCSPYKNLKECEQRLSYFIIKAEEACLKLKDHSFYTSLIRMILGLYLSDPEAGFGMFRLTSLSLLKKAPRQSMFYYNGCKLLRFCRILP